MSNVAPASARSLWSYLTPHKKALALGTLLLLITNGLDKGLVWLFSRAIGALTALDLDTVVWMAMAAAAMAALMWVVRTPSRVVVFNIGRDIEFTLRNELLERVHKLSPSFFRRMSTGDVMSRATNDLGQVRLLVGFGLLNVVNSVFAYVGALILMVALSPELTLWSMLPYPVFMIATRYFGKAVFKRSQESQEALAELSTVAHESLAGARVVRSFVLEEHQKERFGAATDNALKKTMALVMLRNLMWPILVLVSAAGTLIAIWIGGRKVVAGEIAVEDLVAFVFYLGQLVWPTIAFGFLLSVVQRGRASYQRVRDVLDAPIDVAEAPAPVPLAHGSGALSVQHLVYKHGEQTVLDDVSFSVGAKRSLAIVGPTGSGKSTLAALLARLLPTPKDTIALNGQDITEPALRDVRKAIGFAPQEPFLFSTTVARNIGLGLADPDGPDAMERIVTAAGDAAILDEIEALPKGFDTVVGERGVQLSGGQRQRTALARALLNEPVVLVLDDPLSAVDARTEATILRALDRAGEGRTVVLITNRIAAAARAEHVVVLDAGKIVERGTHETLLRHGGLYARLAARQSLEQELEQL